MNWTIPGTVLEARRQDADQIPSMFRSMYMAGDIALGQVASLSGLEPYMIQNWVKRGFLSPPKAKRYSLNQLCRILNINMLKGALPMDRICGLLTYINGQLDDESDDRIDDSQLYFLFVRLAARLNMQPSEEEWQEALKGYTEKYPGDRQRVEKVLRVMLAAWISTNMRTEAEQLLLQLQ